jgi:hypothetical protein
MDLQNQSSPPQATPKADFDPSVLAIDYSSRPAWDAIRIDNLVSHKHKFQYMIHGIHDGAVDRLLKPTGIQGAYVSLSIIDRHHAATYFPCGQILNVPGACIMVASPGDLGVGNKCNSDPDLLKQDIENAAIRSQEYKTKEAMDALGKKMYPHTFSFKPKGPVTAEEQVAVYQQFKKEKGEGKHQFPAALLSPDEVLSHTALNRHNEVACLGTVGTDRIEVIALFVIFTDEDPQIKEGLNPTVKPVGLSDLQWQKIQEAHTNLGFPVVAIKYDKKSLGPAK